jgi:hypothetical protein
VSVKSGGVNASMVRDLKGVLEREKAEIGLFVTLEEPSGPMQLEATTAGVYHSELSGKDYQRIQILTIRDLLERGRKPDLRICSYSGHTGKPNGCRSAKASRANCSDSRVARLLSLSADEPARRATSPGAAPAPATCPS